MSCLYKSLYIFCLICLTAFFSFICSYVYCLSEYSLLDLCVFLVWFSPLYVSAFLRVCQSSCSCVHVLFSVSVSLWMSVARLASKSCPYFVHMSADDTWQSKGYNFIISFKSLQLSQNREPRQKCNMWYLICSEHKYSTSHGWRPLIYDHTEKNIY